MNKIAAVVVVLVLGAVIASQFTGSCSLVPKPPIPIPPIPVPPIPVPPKPSPLPDGLRFGVVNEVDSLDVLAGVSVPVLVKFGAQWCGPCQTIAKPLQEFAVDVGQDVLVVALEVTRARATFEKFRITGMPTLVVMKGSSELGRREGAMSAGQISKFVDGAIHANRTK